MKRITRDPEVLGGKPIVRGTRISVELINDWIESGVSPGQIVEDYPGLTLVDVVAAVAYKECLGLRPGVRYRASFYESSSKVQRRHVLHAEARSMARRHSA